MSKFLVDDISQCSNFAIHVVKKTAVSFLRVHFPNGKPIYLILFACDVQYCFLVVILKYRFYDELQFFSFVVFLFIDSSFKQIISLSISLFCCFSKISFCLTRAVLSLFLNVFSNIFNLRIHCKATIPIFLFCKFCFAIWRFQVTNVTYYLQEMKFSWHAL